VHQSLSYAILFQKSSIWGVSCLVIDKRHHQAHFQLHYSHSLNSRQIGVRIPTNKIWIIIKKLD